jgi:hypothetical protein
MTKEPDSRYSSPLPVNSRLQAANPPPRQNPEARIQHLWQHIFRGIFLLILLSVGANIYQTRMKNVPPSSEQPASVMPNPHTPMPTQPPRPPTHTPIPTVFGRDLSDCPNLAGLPYEVLGYVRTNANSINIRNGPGTNYTKVDMVANRNRICLRGRSRDGTWGMLSRGRWVSMSLIQLPTSQQEPFWNLPITD